MSPLRPFSLRTIAFVTVMPGFAAALCACGGNDQAVAKGPTAAEACAALDGKTIGGAKLSAAAVAASAAVPTYCNVTGTLAPKLNFAIRLPEAWNGKLYYGGGGGYNGSVPDITTRPWTLAPLTQGYVMAMSDSGHQGSAVDASFALNDAFAAQLFGSLSIPTVMSTAIETVTAAYGAPPVKSYYEGCSNGGREGLMSLQRYPNLFDGVIARSAAFNWVGFMGHFNKTAKAVAAPGGAFSAAKIATLAKAVRETCDGLDGIVDGVVSNQAACNAAFDPSVLRCAGGADTGDACLSDPQLDVIKAWTSEVSYTGSPTFRSAGWSLTGNEDDPGAWPAWLTGSNGNVTSSARFLFQDTTVKNYLARDPNADSLQYFPWDQNQNALYALGALNDATNANILPFVNSGGKLILWHGGNDAAVNNRSVAEYYKNVVAAVGGQTAADQFMRLYIAPGVNHCVVGIGGPGADTVDLLTSLDEWVTGKSVPGTLLAKKLDSSGNTVFERPLCQYPKYPHYIGPPNDPNAAKLATNYDCRT